MEQVNLGTRKSVKALQTSEKIGKAVKEYYLRAHEAKAQGKPICWVTAIDPIEVLYAFDIYPVLPENFATVCSSRQVAPELMESAEVYGYSQDLCSYARICLGTLFGDKGPWGGMPEPDFFIVCRNACNTHLKWWQAMARHLNKPIFVLDMPFMVEDTSYEEVEDAVREYFVAQLRDLIKFLERQTGQKIDYKKLEHTVALSDRASYLWNEVLEYRKAVPTPMGAADSFVGIFPLVTMPGTELAVKLYEELLREVIDHVEKKIGAVPNERFRLLFDNIPLWYNLGLYNYVEERGAVFVIETYSTTWSGRLDPKYPLESLALKCGKIWLNSCLDIKIKKTVTLAREYKVDGAVFHSNMSCKSYSIGQVELQKALRDELGIPSFLFQADMADIRKYADAPTKERFNVFLETLARS